MGRSWIWLVLCVAAAVGCEAVAKFDRDKIGQPVVPPSTIRRDAGSMRVDAGAQRDAEAEDELDADVEQPDEDMEAGLDGGAPDGEAPADGEASADGEATQDGEAPEDAAVADAAAELDGAPDLDAQADADVALEAGADAAFDGADGG